MGEEVAERIRVALVEGTLSCGQAFRVAHDLGLEPVRVREEADRLKIRISRCQLGLFGHRSNNPKGKLFELMAEVPAPLAEGLQRAAQEGRVPCAEAWALANRLGVSRLAMGSAAEALGIYITSCQLGCF